jgi:hypothetical protein
LRGGWGVGGGGAQNMPLIKRGGGGGYYTPSLQKTIKRAKGEDTVYPQIKRQTRQLSKDRTANFRKTLSKDITGNHKQTVQVQL